MISDEFAERVRLGDTYRICGAAMREGVLHLNFSGSGVVILDLPADHVFSRRLFEFLSVVKRTNVIGVHMQARERSPGDRYWEFFE